MKLIFITFFLNIIVLFSQTSITPFTYDIKGVEASGDTVVVFGSKGAGMISYDNAENWKHIQPFPNDNIARIFIEQNRLVAFSDVNKISVSEDGGDNWSIVADYKDTINYITTYNQEYYIRSSYNLIKINKLLKKEQDIELSISYEKFNYYNKNNSVFTNNPNFFNSIEIFKESLIILDSNKIFKLDFSFNKKDSLILNKEFASRVFSSEKNLFIKAGDFIWDITDFDNTFKILNYETKNEKLFGGNGNSISNLKFINNTFYCLNLTKYNFIGPYFRIYEIVDSNKANFLGEIDLEEKNKRDFFHFNDYVINKKKIICVANDRFLNIFDIKNKINRTVSDLWGTNNQDPNIVFINDSSFLYQIEDITGPFDDSKKPKLLITRDRGNSFEHLQNDSILFNTLGWFRFRSFDRMNNMLSFLLTLGASKSVIFQTRDFGNTFSVDTINGISLQSYTNVVDFRSFKDNYLIGMSSVSSKEFSIIYQLDKDYNLVNTIKDSNYSLVKVNAKNHQELVTLNNIWMLEDSLVDNYFIQQTTNSGKDWIRLGENGGTEAKDSLRGFLGVDEITYKDRDYWLLYSYNIKESIFTVKTFDLNSYKYEELYSFTTELPNKYYKDYFVTSLVKNDTIHLSIKDTLYLIPNIQDKSNWKKIPLPDNGFFGFKYPLNKFGESYFGYYSDENHSPSLYWVTLDESGINSIEEAETQRNYLYTLPPYPLPTQNEVKVQFYWDINLPMSVDDVSIYDISGKEVQTKDKLRIDKQANHYGNLIWDCSGQQAGVYIINIKHGTEEKAVKVVVE